MVNNMARKKKFKLKKKFKKILVILFIIMLLPVFGKKIYENYQYKKTDEYKFLEKGYELDVINLFEEKLGKEEIDYLLDEDKIDYISEIIDEKYFMVKNFYAYIEFYEENDKKDFSDVVALVNVGATREWYEDTHVADVSKGYSLLSNKFFTLPEDYSAGEIKKFSSTYAYGKVSAEVTVYNAFITMAKAAKTEGITLILTSGYRTREYQKGVYDDMVKRKGQSYADEYAARPGHSEHETGYALDILTYNGITETFHETETYAWLHQNAYKFGFIERYPQGKEYITGFSAESWHYRYVGEELAEKVYNEGITYDEYYAFYIAN